MPGSKKHKPIKSEAQRRLLWMKQKEGLISKADMDAKEKLRHGKKLPMHVKPKAKKKRR